jgi:predicted Zn-dependent protease
VTEDSARDGVPAGEVYDWFVRGTTLLESGNPEAAAELLAHAHSREPESASVLEALARALFDARRYAGAADRFTELVELSPDSDYARFGLGLSRLRLGDLGGAIEQLALAAAMRPERAEYQQVLREARATARAREEAAGRRSVDAGGEHSSIDAGGERSGTEGGQAE